MLLRPCGSGSQSVMRSVTSLAPQAVRPPSGTSAPCAAARRAFSISIHGIHPSMTLGSPTFAELWPLLAERIGGSPVVAHNASFDMSVLRHELDHLGLGYPDLEYYCTLVLSRACWPGLYSPTGCPTWRRTAGSRFVAEAHPLRVTLFGSAARGDMTPGSDIDLLVVMPDGRHRLHTMQRLYGSIRGVVVPFDILVATTADLKARGEALGLICRRFRRPASRSERLRHPLEVSRRQLAAQSTRADHDAPWVSEAHVNRVRSALHRSWLR